MTFLKRITPDELETTRRDPVDPACIEPVRAMLAEVRAEGEDAVRRIATSLGDLGPDDPLWIERVDLDRARDALPRLDREVLERTAERIRAFARVQRTALGDAVLQIGGGRAGHVVTPLERAGCYAPGGRYPLPSSVLMTACCARVAGVRDVIVASPRPSPVTLAAAGIAGVDRVLAVGGAQAIGALAFGVQGSPPVDVIVGPGNRWVTAAKQQVAGHVRIDFLAGPSELVVLADASADPATVASDLIAQAEHDVDACPVLVTTDVSLADAVERELACQLDQLPTAETARAAFERQGTCVVCACLDEAVAVTDRLAPEHLEVMTAVAVSPRRYGGLFRGALAGEVLGDYGAGPNHVLPTGATARFQGGLSVFDFLAVRTWLEFDDADGAQVIVGDAAHLARLEGLEGHARSAERRLT